MTPTGDAQFHYGGESGGGTSRTTTSGCWIVNMPPSTSSLAPVNRTLSSIKSPSPTVTHTMLKTPPTSPVTWRILPPPQACCAIRNTPDWCCFTKYYSTCHLEPTGSWWFHENYVRRCQLNILFATQGFCLKPLLLLQQSLCGFLNGTRRVIRGGHSTAPQSNLIFSLSSRWNSKKFSVPRVLCIGKSSEKNEPN